VNAGRDSSKKKKGKKKKKRTQRGIQLPHLSATSSRTPGNINEKARKKRSRIVRSESRGQRRNLFIKVHQIGMIHRKGFKNANTRERKPRRGQPCHQRMNRMGSVPREKEKKTISSGKRSSRPQMGHEIFQRKRKTNRRCLASQFREKNAINTGSRERKR